MCHFGGVRRPSVAGIDLDVAVVDEAHRRFPSDLIPMRRADRLVLCGDPPASAHREEPEGEVLKETMLERLIDEHADETVMLEVQHRMHASIMSAGNERFYGEIEGARRRGSTHIEDIKPWVWVDTAGCGFDEQRSEEAAASQSRRGSVCVGPSCRLADAASRDVTRNCGALFGAGGVAQGALDRARARRRTVLSSADVTIHTVDGFQGQERDGMLVSLTRSNDRGEVGFSTSTVGFTWLKHRARMARACLSGTAPR